MKKALITFALLVGVHAGFGQAIDTAALQLMQKSWDKLTAIENISYRMMKVDTMIRENQFVVNWIRMDGTIKKNAYWHIRFENNSEWLIRGDTLYKKENTGTKPLTFVTDWDRHKMGVGNIHNILGTERPDLNNDMESLQFIEGASGTEFYVIEQVYKNAGYKTDETESKLRYNRYFIDKKSGLTLRRLQYGKRLENGREAVDIYDFTAVIDTSKCAFNPAAFFYTEPVKEVDRLATLKIGDFAPPFKATDVRTGKPVSLAELKGKIVVLDFWYLSCMPCRELMPKLQKLQEKFAKDKVVFVGINLRDTAPKAIIQFLNAKQILYPQFYQAQQLLAWDYKLQAFPTTLIVGTDSKVKLAEIGLGEDTALKLELAIKKELKAKHL